MAQQAPALSINQIMQGYDFTGYPPEDIRWSADSETIFFNWNPDREILSSLYRVSLRDLSPEKIALEEQKKLPVYSGDYSSDFKKMVYEKNGDLYLLDVRSGDIRQVTGTVEQESNPKFTFDDSEIVFERDNNLFTWTVEDGGYRQVTNFTPEAPEKDIQLSQREKWLEHQQYELFEVLNDRKAEQEASENREDLLSPHRPCRIHLEGRILSRLTMSPDKNFVLFVLAKRPEGDLSTKIPGYVTGSGYLDIDNVRAKVGSPRTTYELGIYNRKRDTVYYVSTEQIPGIYDKPEFLKEYVHPDSTYDHTYDNPRKVSFPGIFFNEKGDRAALVIRSHDNKDRWIMELDMEDGSLYPMDRQRDEAWIGGPGISIWNFESGNCGWLDDDTFWFQSEESGYSHIYSFHVPSGEKSRLTSGDWEVYEVSLSRDKNYFYITANKEGPFERHFYRMPAKGGELTRYTSQPGNYEVTVSPDDKMLAIRHSYSNKPWELYIMPNRPGAEMQRVTHSTTEEFNRYEWKDPEIVYFTASDGMKVPARLYRPNPTGKKGPAVIFVHGAGYLQNVHRWWSSYYREYMFHNYLVDQGYTVLDVDYRGSEGYGRDWRTAIYRHMGGKDLSDQADGARYLVENCDVDEDRIGIYGGSYGGFITIFALFEYPAVFRCGAALRSVTDWAHYNHDYTSNILNTPAEDSIAYRRSSPIYKAEGFQGELLMLHGMVDDNVQFQDVVRLSQRLIELGKKDWQLAVFPLEDHSFKESSSWSDEYRRIFKLFEKNLK